MMEAEKAKMKSDFPASQGVILPGGKNMRVAIIGSGFTGAYFDRLLRDRQQGVEIFGRDPKTSFGINPCPWGTRIEADLAIFDKPSLIKGLLRLR
jgi:hypothetical protein